MWLLSLLICLLGATACDEKSPASPAGPLDQQIVLAPGAVAGVEGTGVRIRFEGVAGDSRCPVDVVCIHAGDAIVRIDVLAADGGRTEHDLHTGGPRSVRHGRLAIELLRLEPQPVSTRRIEPHEYRATLRVTSD